MSHSAQRRLRRTLMLLRLLCAVMVVGSSGCKGDTKEASPTQASSDAGPAADAPSSEGFEPAIADKSLARRASGTMDVHNRYASTVMLTEEPLGRAARCSAVLLSPRVALTAASCMCSPRKIGAEGLPEKRIIQPADCPARTFLRTVQYGDVYDREFREENTTKSFRTFEGQIRPHPEFKLVLDAWGSPQAADADLAVIVLDSPVKDPLPFVQLGESEVKEKEVLVMAGYPSDARFSGFGSIRYFRQNRVTRIADGQAGRILYEQQGIFLYNGYAGGPCLREDQGRQWLVGVAGVGSDRELYFTSTYLFRGWLSAELQRAGVMDAAPIPSPRQ